MPYELFIALRYLRARRRQTAVSIVTVIAVAGIAAGVAALIFAQGLANGFREEVQEKILGGTAHLNLLTTDNSGIENYRELTNIVRQVPGVSSASATIYEPVLISAGDRQEPAVIKGIDFHSGEAAVSELSASLIEGSPEDLRPRPSGQSAGEQSEPPVEIEGTILGKDLARTLGVKRGDMVTVFSARTRLTPIGPAPRYARLRVVGIFSAGLYEYDSKWAYVSLALAQRLTGSGETAGVIQMKVSDIYAVREIGERVLAAVQAAAQSGKREEFMTTNWQELNRPLFAALKMQQRVVVVFFLVLIVIAALNIITTLTMMVLEKQSDIAILRAQGATSQSIRRIFTCQGLMIGVIGALIGTVLGPGLAQAANVWRLISIPAEIYSVSYITLRVHLQDCLLTAFLAVFISFLATLYPVRSASQINPAEALRHE
ncbi:MAG TPA: ABC transporter permease [Blastocatellia bacterium]|nr:ABC transporter permease [Blastocatellia bacterium]